MITLLDNELQTEADHIRNQKYILIFYKPDDKGYQSALVILEGQNNLNEQGTYRVYGGKDNPVFEIDVNYDQASWRYSFFAKPRILYIQGTKTGVIGNPTAHLMAAICE